MELHRSCPLVYYSFVPHAPLSPRRDNLSPPVLLARPLGVPLVITQPGLLDGLGKELSDLHVGDGNLCVCVYANELGRGAYVHVLMCIRERENVVE